VCVRKGKTSEYTHFLSLFFAYHELYKYTYCWRLDFVVRFASESSATSGPKSLSLFLFCFVSTLEEARRRASNTSLLCRFLALSVPRPTGTGVPRSVIFTPYIRSFGQTVERHVIYLKSSFEVSRRVLLTFCSSQKSKPFYEGRRRREPGAATPRANSIPGPAQPLLLIASFPSPGRAFLSWLEEIRD